MCIRDRFISFKLNFFFCFSVQSEYNSSKIRMELQWSLEKGYDASAPLETEPLRTFGAGALTDYNFTFMPMNKTRTFCVMELPKGLRYNDVHKIY